MRGLGSAFLLLTMAVAPSAASAQARAAAGPPADICKELAAFLHPSAPAAAPAGPASGQTAVQAPGGASTPTPPAGGDPQKNSGLSGPTPNGGPGASGPQGNAQNAAAPSGATAAPAPAAAAPSAPAPKLPSPEAIQSADAAIGRNDLAACQASARQMRKVGVVMPAPLMSLAALDLKFLEAAR